MRQDEIRIVDYESSWPLQFEGQRKALTRVFSDVLLRPIDHVGSTSVPGLPAKSIIDMLAVVTDYDAAGGRLARLTDIGWIAAPEPEDEPARKHSACYPSVERRTHHLHVVESDWGWPDLLLFRDYLRAYPTVASEYAALKRRLAQADARDRPRYRAAKAPFILDTLEAARQWQSTEVGRDTDRLPVASVEPHPFRSH